MKVVVIQKKQYFTTEETFRYKEVAEKDFPGIDEYIDIDTFLDQLYLKTQNLLQETGWINGGQWEPRSLENRSTTVGDVFRLEYENGVTQDFRIDNMGFTMVA